MNMLHPSKYITLKTQAVYSSKALLSFYQMVWHGIQDDRNFHIYCHANFKSQLLSLICTECVSSENKVFWHHFLYQTTLNSWYENNLNQILYSIC